MEDFNFDDEYFTMDYLPDDTSDESSDNDQDDDGEDDSEDDIPPEDDEVIKYEWISNGGCAVCEDMSTILYEEEPEPPHILCNCTVKEIKRPPHSRCKRELSIQLSELRSIHHFDIPKEFRTTFTVEMDYIIHCPDGTEIEGTSSVELDYEDFYSWVNDDIESGGDLSIGMILNEILQDIEADTRNECKPCEVLPVS